MRFKRHFCITLAFFLALWGLSSSIGSSSVETIDKQIEELEEMKRGYEGRALRHENQAEYLQFDSKAWLETRRHLEIAEENRQKAALVQKKIDELKAERQKLQKGS